MKNGLMLAGVGFMAQQRLALTGPVVPRLRAYRSLRSEALLVGASIAVRPTRAKLAPT